jgi:hypothetical protein
MTNARDKANIPALNFSSTGIDDNATSTAVTILSDGKVGIGTVNPVRELHVDGSTSSIAIGKNGSGSATLRFYSDGSQKSYIQLDSSENMVYYAPSGTDQQFYASGSEKMRLNSTGLGIGTSSPAAGLEVSNSSGIKISRSGYSQYMQLYPANNNVPTILGLGGNGIHIGTTTSTGIHVDGSDNVGIGTTSPVSKVNIEATKTTALSSMNDFLTLGLTVDDNTTYNEGVGGGIAFRGKRQSGGQQTVYGAIVGTKIDNSSDGYNGHLRFFTNNNSNGVPTEHLRITSAGLVGIGETAPQGKLHVRTADSGATVNLEADELIVENGTSGSAVGISILSATNGYGNLFFGDSGDNNVGLVQYDHSSNAMRFFTNGSERMRITSSGQVGIGTTSPAEKFHVVDTGSSQAAKIHSDTNNSGVLGMSVLAGQDSATNSGDCKWIRLADGNDSGKAYIQFKGSGPNAEFAAISDERLKTNIQDTDVVGLDVISNLRLVKFDWNETATQDAGWSMTGHQKLGFIAQEVEQILPEFISEDTNGFKIMGDSGFVPYLIKAMQEQQTKIQELEARITTLEANNP